MTNLPQTAEIVRIDGVVRAQFSGRDCLTVIADTEGREFELRTRKPITRGGKGILVSIEARVTGHKMFRETERAEISLVRDMVVTEDHPMRRR